MFDREIKENGEHCKNNPLYRFDYLVTCVKIVQSKKRSILAKTENSVLNRFEYILTRVNDC